MIKKIACIMFLLSPLSAEGPIFQHGDSIIDREFDNAYKDIRGVLKGDVRISSVTIGTAVISNLYATIPFSPPVYSSVTIQIKDSYIGTSSATTVTSFVRTGLSVTLTPQYSTSRIKLSASGTVSIATIQRQCYATLARDLSDMSFNNAGFGNVGNSGTATPLGVPWSAVYIDRPATTSAITYNVMIRTSNSASACTFNEATGTASLIVEELR